MGLSKFFLFSPLAALSELYFHPTQFWNRIWRSTGSRSHWESPPSSAWTMARFQHIFFFMLSCIKSHGIFFVLAYGIYFICNRVIVPHRRRRIPNSQQYASLNHQQIVENNLHSEERSVIEHVIMLLARLPNSCLHWIPGWTDVGYLCYQANAAVERHDMFRYSCSSA